MEEDIWNPKRKQGRPKKTATYMDADIDYLAELLVEMLMDRKKSESSI